MLNADALAAARAEVERRAEALSRAFARFEEARDLVRRLEVGDPAEPPNPRALTISTSEAAERCGRSTDTIQRWCACDGIGVKVGGRWRVYPDRLHSLFARL